MKEILPSDLIELIFFFKKKGYELYLVGGCVRDYVLNNIPKDYDLTSDASSEEIKKILETSTEYKFIPFTGNEFNISIVNSKYNSYEIATFREDITEGRKPEVRTATLTEDVFRRDLKINALVYDYYQNKIIDLTGGLDDIKNKKITCVGDPSQRFREDPLRKLRVIRFKSTLGFEIDETTKNVLSNDISLPISKERIREEFIKGISKGSVSYLQSLDDFGMLTLIFPDTILNKEFFESTSPEEVIAYLLKNNDIDVITKSLTMMKWTSSEIRNICFLVELIKVHFEKDNFYVNCYSLKKKQSNFTLKTNIRQWLILNHISEKKASVFDEYELSISGDVLLKEGYEGKVLKQELIKREIQEYKKIESDYFI